MSAAPTNAVADRPPLTYRDSSAADASLDRGANAGGRGSSTTTSGPSREPTPDRAPSTSGSGRERPPSGRNGDRTGPGFGSDRRPNPADRESPVGRDDAGSGPIDRSDRSSARRPASTRAHTPDPDSRGRNRFEGIELPSGTDPRFDADVDRAVQELYRRLERKIRIERERRGL